MPKIREYTSQVQAVGPDGGVRANAESFGAAIGRGLQQGGEGVTDTANTMYKNYAQNEVSDLGAKASDVYKKHTEKMDAAIRDGSLNSEQFLKDYRDEMDSLSENVTTREGRLFLQNADNEMTKHFSISAFHGQAELTGEKTKQNKLTELNNFSTSLIKNPDAFDSVRQQYALGIEQNVALGQLDRVKANELLRHGEKTFAESAVTGWIDSGRQGPEFAKQQLDTGRYDSFFDGDTKTKLYGNVDQAIRARNVEDERLRKEQERILEEQRKQVSQAWMDKLGKGTLSTKEIINNPIMEAMQGPDSKRAWLDMIDTNNKKAGQTNNALFARLFRDINRSYGDDKKLLKREDINKYVAAGQITPHDAVFLTKQLEDQSTVEGKYRQEQWKKIETEATKIIVGDPALGLANPNGQARYSQFISFAMNEVQKAQAENKDPGELLDANSPKYIFRQEIKDQYTQTFKEYADSLKQAMQRRTQKPADIGDISKMGLDEIYKLDFKNLNREQLDSAKKRRDELSKTGSR